MSNTVAIEVFDPALCCSTGVCGVDVDQHLVIFAADVDWFKQSGGRIEQFNLAHQPMAFAERVSIRATLQASGQDALPITLVDGAVRLTGRYPTRDELAEWSREETAPSIFTDQVAELVAIGAAIASNCEPCLDHHVARGRELGVRDADMLLAVELAQKVKESPARAVLSLARKHLRGGEPQPGPRTIAVPMAAPTQAGCCSPTNAEQPDQEGPCC